MVLSKDAKLNAGMRDTGVSISTFGGLKAYGHKNQDMDTPRRSSK